MEIDNVGELEDLEDIITSVLKRPTARHTEARELRHMYKHKTPKAIRRKRATRKMAKQSRRKNRK